MYSAHNEGKWVITETFVKTVKSKIYKKKYSWWQQIYLSYLNQLVDQYNNTIIVLLKKPINADCSHLTEKI